MEEKKGEEDEEERENEHVLYYIDFSCLLCDPKPFFDVLRAQGFDKQVRYVKCQQMEHDASDLLVKIHGAFPDAALIDIVGEETLGLIWVRAFFRELKKFNKMLVWFDCAYLCEEEEKQGWRDFLQTTEVKNVGLGPHLRTLFPMDHPRVKNNTDILARYYCR